MKQELPLGQAHRLLSPRPVALLTVRYKGQVNVMTIAWTCPISLTPPLVMMAIHPSRYTHDMLKRSEECVLNIPGRPLLEQVVKCGSVSGAEGDKVQIAGLRLESARRVEAPWIDQCLAHIECHVVDMWMPGDHALFVAEVVGAWAEGDAFDGVWLAPADTEELQPLYHLGGDRFCLIGAKLRYPEESPEG
jgi:flavin reductase (DIM6/NTAB) family NADH-FMN oxidoreductase RutF